MVSTEELPPTTRLDARSVSTVRKVGRLRFLQDLVGDEIK